MPPSLLATSSSTSFARKHHGYLLPLVLIQRHTQLIGKRRGQRHLGCGPAVGWPRAPLDGGNAPTKGTRGVREG
jgi:hypothetical protein